MPVEGVEWAIIAIVSLLMLLWKPENIAELFKAIIRVRSEFAKAQSEFNKMISFNISPSTSTSYTPLAKEGARVQGVTELSEDMRLLKVARELNIGTEGLTRQDIRDAINAKLKDLVSALETTQKGTEDGKEKSG
ncbi:MAG: hypothetical protein NZ920_03465 [Aigarchaeota archaeon]|nr:hypothetical protein [Aigarchaeota archaeon]MDW8092322.1 hypothetical protein [Nitrososphaerota archaeon]